MTTEQEQRANDLLQALAAQRNAALDQAASLHADLMAAKRKIAELEEQLAKQLESTTEVTN